MAFIGANFVAKPLAKPIAIGATSARTLRDLRFYKTDGMIEGYVGSHMRNRLIESILYLSDGDVRAIALILKSPDEEFNADLAIFVHEAYRRRSYAYQLLCNVLDNAKTGRTFTMFVDNDAAKQLCDKLNEKYPGRILTTDKFTPMDSQRRR